MSPYSKLTVELVTPLGHVATLDGTSVVAPGELGEFEVMLGHIPFLSALYPGLLHVKTKQQDTVFAIGSGFLRVNDSGVVEVLVEKAIQAEDVDKESAELSHNAAKQSLDAWKGAVDGDWLVAKQECDWAQAQLAASDIASN